MVIKVNGETYQQQYRKCCRSCIHGASGEGHGPYWYKSSPGTPLKYVGKELPATVTNHLTMLEEQKSDLKILLSNLDDQLTDEYKKYQHTSRLIHALECLMSGDELQTDLLTELKLEKFLV
jgi:hypothetical protein